MKKSESKMGDRDNLMTGPCTNKEINQAQNVYPKKLLKETYLF